MNPTTPDTPRRRGPGLACAFAWLLAALAVPAASAQVPVLEFKFNEPGPTAPDTGPFATHYASNLSPATRAAGVSGATHDLAFDNTASTGMGSPYGGGRVLSSDLDQLDGLASFTLQGWYHVPAGTVIGGNARLFDKWTGSNGGFALRAIGGGKLALTVNGQDITSAQHAYYSATGGWIFFAATYDGTRQVDNVSFYTGFAAGSVTLVSRGTLNQGAALANAVPLGLGNAPVADDRPWDGRLDNLRIFGAKGGGEGALTQQQLEQIRARDASPAQILPPPLVEFLFNQPGTVAPNTGSDLLDASLKNSSGTATDLHLGDGSGVSGLAADRAFSTGATAMSASAGRGEQADTPSIDGLRAFTLTGWFRPDQAIGAAARILDNKGALSGGFLLRANETTDAAGYAGTKRLALTVNENTAFSGEVFAETAQWVFFAVTYDADAGSDHVRFYKGLASSPAVLVNAAALNAGAAADTASVLTLGNAPHLAGRAFAGRLDNLRVYRGALQPEQIEARRALDTGLPASARSLAPEWTLRLDNPLSTYAPGSLVRATLSGRGTGLTLVSVVRDFAGVSVWNDTTSPASSGDYIHHALDLPSSAWPRGYYQLEVQIRNAAGATVATLTRGIAVIPDLAAAFAHAGNAFGAMVNAHDIYPVADKERDAQFMKRAGLRHVRTHRFNWIHHSPLSNNTSSTAWDPMDQEIALYKNTYGLKILATTGWPTPEWASDAAGYAGHPNRGYFAPALARDGDLVAFYTALGQKYGGLIDYFEVGNEVDAYFWMGRVANFQTSNSHEITRDFARHYGLVAGAIRGQAPAAKIGPGTTASIPEGHLHEDWLDTILDFRAAGEMAPIDHLSVHYDADLPAARDTYDAHSLAAPPFIVSEIGGFWRGNAGDPATLPFGDGMKTLIKGDYHDTVVQLSRGAVATCKFLLREQNSYGGEGLLLAGLVEKDFNVRPSYVAYATLADALAGATAGRRLNLDGDVPNPARLEGYGFTGRDGQPVNVLFLNGTVGDATVTVRAAGPAVTLVNPMGVAQVLSLAGTAAPYTGSFTMNGRLPVIVRGALLDHAGSPAPFTSPAGVSIPVSLQNPSFDTSAGNTTGAANWSPMNPGPLQFSRVTDIKDHGAASLRLHAPSVTAYCGIAQTFTAPAAMKNLGPNEYLAVKIRARVRGESIDGMGLGTTFNIRRSTADYTIRLHGDNGNYGHNGTFAWRQLEADMAFDYWPSDATICTLEFHLCYSTGTAWIDNVELTVTKHTRAN